MNLFSHLRSIPGDAFRFAGASGRDEYAIKLGFWSVAIPTIFFTLVALDLTSLLFSSSLVAFLYGAFLLPLSIRRSRAVFNSSAHFAAMLAVGVMLLGAGLGPGGLGAVHGVLLVDPVRTIRLTELRIRQRSRCIVIGSVVLLAAFISIIPFGLSSIRSSEREAAAIEKLHREDFYNIDYILSPVDEWNLVFETRTTGGRSRPQPYDPDIPAELTASAWVRPDGTGSLGISIEHAIPRLGIVASITAMLCQCRKNQDPLSTINVDLETDSDGRIRVGSISAIGRLKRNPLSDDELNDFIQEIETSINRMSGMQQ